MKRKVSGKTQASPPADAQGKASIEMTEVPDEVSGTLDSARSWVKRGTYKTFYAVSYGVVFSSLLIKKLLIPKDSVVEKGLHDGAIAAEHAFEEKVRLFEETAKETEKILAADEPPAAPA